VDISLQAFLWNASLREISSHGKAFPFIKKICTEFNLDDSRRITDTPLRQNYEKYFTSQAGVMCKFA
jgi:hypothetical protein